LSYLKIKMFKVHHNFRGHSKSIARLYFRRGKIQEMWTVLTAAQTTPMVHCVAARAVAVSKVPVHL
jgi:hypothetical protein